MDFTAWMMDLCSPPHKGAVPQRVSPSSCWDAVFSSQREEIPEDLQKSKKASPPENGAEGCLSRRLEIRRPRGGRGRDGLIRAEIHAVPVSDPDPCLSGCWRAIEVSQLTAAPDSLFGPAKLKMRGS